MARFTDASGQRVNRSTKQTNRKTAQSVADKWEAAALKARSHELTQAASVKILGELMEVTLGEKLHVVGIADFLHAYVSSRETIGRSAATAKRYQSVMDSFLKHLSLPRHKASLPSLSVGEIESWRDAELKTGKGGTTADFGIKVLRAALGSARRKGIVLSNVAEAVELVGDAAEEREPFELGELKSLLAAATTDWKGAILSGLWCGPRLADTANLLRENVDLEAEVMRLNPSKTSRKGKKQLVIAMHPELVAHLKTLPPVIGGAPLFPSLYGRKAGSYGGLSNEFGRLMEKAGVRLTLGPERKGVGRRFRSKGFHSLRHTMISRMANAEVSADVRRAMAGHSSDAAHRRYVHLNVVTQRKAIEKLPAISG